MAYRRGHNAIGSSRLVYIAACSRVHDCERDHVHECACVRACVYAGGVFIEAASLASFSHRKYSLCHLVCNILINPNRSCATFFPSTFPPECLQ